MAVPLTSFNYLYNNRLVVRTQGGYFFFMYFITSASATNKMISNTVSVKYITPFHKGAGTTAAVPLLFNYIEFP